MIVVIRGWASSAAFWANSISYEISVNGAVVTTTEYGTLVADTTGSVTANGASEDKEASVVVMSRTSVRSALLRR